MRSPHSGKPCKNTSVLVGTVLKRAAKDVTFLEVSDIVQGERGHEVEQTMTVVVAN